MFEPRKLERRYSFNPHPHFGHVKTISFVGRNKKVLDTGCATGYLAKKFKENDCYVAGVEIDEESTRVAKQYCDEIIVGDLEQIKELPYPERFFDVIVYGDILEHLKRPDLVLKSMKKYLKNDGYVVACIPNFLYYRNRFKMLLGKFQYQDTGTLDFTHLRFFTLKTAKKLFESCSYRICKVDYTGACSYLRGFFPTLLAFQFIIIAKMMPRNKG